MRRITLIPRASRLAAPSPRAGPMWHIDTLVTLLAAAGNSAKKEIASTVLFLM